jgi:hypothetical protein
MSTLFNRRILVPVWVGVVLGLFTLLGPPLTLATGSLLLFMAIALPAVMLMLWRPPSLTLAESIAEVLHPVDRSRTE